MTACTKHRGKNRNTTIIKHSKDIATLRPHVVVIKPIVGEKEDYRQQYFINTY
jgi:hypothetical protein